MATESIKLYNLDEKKVKNKKKLKPFKHLKSEINVSTIENAPVHLYDPERLPETKNHFNKIKEKHYSNIEIVNAVDNIILKIDNIINLGNKNFSGEIMKAANNDNYGEKKYA